MNTKHTPGPWKIVHEADSMMICGTVKENGVTLEMPICEADFSQSEESANAKLIAVAPELGPAIKKATE